MNPSDVKASYRRMMDDAGEWVKLERHTGQGINHPVHSIDVRAKVAGYQPDEIVGSIVQGDRKIIILAQDLIDAQFALPIRSSDKVVVRGKQLSIIAPDDSTRRIGKTVIAYELTGRG